MGALKINRSDCGSHYDAETGRWISEDPIGFDGGFNVYQYGRNNPTRYIDFNGLDPVNIEVARQFLEQRYPQFAPPRSSTIVETSLLVNRGQNIPFTDIVFIPNGLSELETTSILSHEAQHINNPFRSAMDGNFHDLIDRNQDIVTDDFFESVINRTGINSCQ